MPATPSFVRFSWLGLGKNAPCLLRHCGGKANISRLLGVPSPDPHTTTSNPTTTPTTGRKPCPRQSV